MSIPRGSARIGRFGIGLASARAATLNPDLCSPNDHDFTTTSDNSYFPLRPGQESVFFGVDDGESIGLRITVLNRTELFYRHTNKVITRVVEEFEWVDANENGKFDGGEERVEISRNYFAQTEEGTVCYFGEDVKIYEDGKFKGDTTGSWRADGFSPITGEPNAPGIVMPDSPQVGDVYLQEDAPDVAQDQATNVAIDTGTQALHTSECNLAEGPPDCADPSLKTYAPGRGLVQDGALELTKFVEGK